MDQDPRATDTTAKPKAASDSHGSEEAGALLEIYGHPSGWSWTDPYKIATVVTRNHLGFWLTLALISCFLTMIPLSALLGLLLYYLMVGSARDFLIEKFEPTFSSTLKRWGPRIRHLPAGVVLVAIPPVLLLIGCLFAGGMASAAIFLPDSSLQAQVGGIATIAAIVPVVLCLFTVMVLGPLDVYFGQNGTVSALANTLRMLWSSLAGAFCFFFVYVLCLAGIFGSIFAFFTVLDLVGIQVAANETSLWEVPINFVTSFITNWMAVSATYGYFFLKSKQVAASGGEPGREIFGVE